MGKYYTSKRFWKTVANNKTKAKSHKDSDWIMNEPGQEKAQATEKPVEEIIKAHLAPICQQLGDRTKLMQNLASQTTDKPNQTMKSQCHQPPPPLATSSISGVFRVRCVKVLYSC